MAPYFPPRSWDKKEKKKNSLSSVPHLRMTFNTGHLSSLERELQSTLSVLLNTDCTPRINPNRRDLHDIDTIIQTWSMLEFLAAVINHFSIYLSKLDASAHTYSILPGCVSGCAFFTSHLGPNLSLLIPSVINLHTVSQVCLLWTRPLSIKNAWNQREAAVEGLSQWVVIQLFQVSIKTCCRKSDARIGMGWQERIVSSLIWNTNF